MTNEEAVAIAKSQFRRLGKDSLKAGIAATPFAFLIVPPLNILTDKALDWILTQLTEKAETGIFFLYTNFNVTAQGRAFISAAVANHNAQAGNNEELKKRTEEDLKTAFRNLVRLSK